jgi:hypothetical protein
MYPYRGTYPVLGRPSTGHGVWLCVYQCSRRSIGQGMRSPRGPFGGDELCVLLFDTDQPDRPNHNCPALRNLEALAHGGCVSCENDNQVYTGHAPARDRRTDPRSAEARKSRDLQPLVPNSGSQPHPPTRRYRTSCCSAEAPACDTQRSAPFPCPIVSLECSTLGQ